MACRQRGELSLSAGVLYASRARRCVWETVVAFTASDICSLENILDVGILVMEHETGKLQPTASVYSKKRRGYLFVYFIVSC